MQYQVPQFIETEDKIIGGILTLKQFLIIAAAGGLSFIFYFIFSSFAWLLLTSFVGIIAVGIAFIKIQGRSVPTIVIAAFYYYWGPRFYLWRRDTPESDVDLSEIKTTPEKASISKQFVFHKKERTEIPLFKNQIPKEEPKEFAPMPLDWHITEPAPMPKPKMEHKKENEQISASIQKAKQFVASFPDVLKSVLKEVGDTIKRPLKEEESPGRREAEPKSYKISPELEPQGQFKTENKVSAGGGAALGEKKETIHEIKIVPDKKETKTEIIGSAEEAPLLARQRLAVAGKVRDLFEKIMTSKDSLPKREKKFFSFGQNHGSQYEMLRKATGEVESARRVDYRS